VFSGEKRELLVTVRMKGRVVELLDALIELDILDSRSEAIASIVESTVSSKSKIFKALKTQADDLKRRRNEARELASKEISGKLH
jgi:metal-responsive CopG/Arc/MetJ family transcriptional regulator